MVVDGYCRLADVDLNGNRSPCVETSVVRVATVRAPAVGTTARLLMQAQLAAAGALGARRLRRIRSQRSGLSA